MMLLALSGCAANSADTPSPTDASTAADAGPSPDAGAESDAGLPDSGVATDAGPAEDAGVALPERCHPEFETFEDEFGRRSNCIYVSPGGDDDAGDGSPDSPFASIGHGIEVAIAQGVATGNVHAVAVDQGTYNERVVLANGISVYGGFDASDAWSRAADARSTISNAEAEGGRIEGVVADGISAPTVFEAFDVQAGAAPEGSADVSVYGVRVTGSTPVVEELGGLILRRISATAGAGSIGSDGTAGEAGEAGVNGAGGQDGDKRDGDVTPGGAGSAAICGGMTIESSRGGVGGLGGGDGAMGCGTYRENATAGEAPSAVSSCAGGGAGDACSCVSPIDYNGEDGDAGETCGENAADDGAAAMGSTVRGTVEDGLWAPSAAQDGESGAIGVGGSGGGGGGSGCDAGGWGPTGGGGGGGGSGGCGGAGGSGGLSGGSSFGLFVAQSEISAPDSSFQSGDGGNGGAGAHGGAGGAGGAGGPGGSGGHAGGIGGRGQRGGNGGPGAGGVGGSSVGALICESDVAELDLGAIDNGEAGAGGAPAPHGAEGLAGFASKVLFDCGF